MSSMEEMHHVGGYCLPFTLALHYLMLVEKVLIFFFFFF